MTAAAPRVLLVDDNPQFRGELRLLLEDYGIQVVAEGGNGQEAIQLAASTDVDVVLMEARSANAYAYLVKGCSGALVRDVVAQAFALKTGLQARTRS